MELAKALGTVIRKTRIKRNLSQEAFSDVSSRTYLSTLERAKRSATLAKLDELAQVMEVHPLTLLMQTYALKDGMTFDALVERILIENKMLNE